MSTKLGKYYICDRCGTTSFFEKIGERPMEVSLDSINSKKQKAGILFIRNQRML